MSSILRITDGTEIVDLLNLHGWLLQDWSPAVPEPKTIFRSSPLVSGRQLAYRTMDNITDTFNMVVTGVNQNEVILSIQTLQRLLEKAVEYWTSGWQNVPVWIEAQEPCDEELRYSTIVDYKLTGFGSPYAQPFFSGRPTTEAILVIEHKFWQDTVPGDIGKCVELYSHTVYPSVTNYDSGRFYPAHTLADVIYSSGASSCDTASSSLGVGYVAGRAGISETGIVFENVDIPAGATIKAAWLTLLGISVTSNITVQIRGQSQEGGAINSVTLVTQGKSYEHPEVEVYGAGGSGEGAVIRATVLSTLGSAGRIASLTIVNPGHGYVNPRLVIRDHCSMPPCRGYGATATATASAIGTDAALFDGTNSDFIGRTRTNASTSRRFYTMSPATFTMAIKHIVEEVVGSPYWSTGENIALFITMTSSSGEMTFNSFDNGVNYPYIAIEWSTTTTPVGSETTCAQEVFVANKHASAPIKYIFCNDDSAGTWSPNMFEHDYTTVLPLFQDNTGTAITPAAGDAVYFGSCPIDTEDLEFGPFCSIVFDIFTRQTGVTAAEWQYWDIVGGDWKAFDISGTASNELCSDDLMFDTAGVNSVVWDQGVSWEPHTVHGYDGWWVRYYIVSANGGATGPYQWHRDPYTVNNPYVDIDSDRVPGDIPALARIKFDAAGCAYRAMNTLVLGLRTLSRGEDFDAYLNASDAQQPDGIEFAIEGPTPGVPSLGQALQDDYAAPTGRSLDLTGFDPSETGYTTLVSACSWQFSEDMAKQYVGVYHAYLRCYFSEFSVGNVKLRLRSVFGEEYNVSYSDVVTPTLGGWACALDMGQLSILPSYTMRADDSIGSIKIYLDSFSDDTVNYANSRIYDVVLIPADEWSGNFGMPKLSGTSVLTYDYGIEIDGISTPRQYRAAEVLKPKDKTLPNQYVAEWSRIASSEPIFQANSNQRLWFMQYRHGDGLVSFFENCGSVAAERSSRYLLMRGGG